MKKEILIAWIVFCVLSGTTLGVLVCWAEDHPESELYEKFTDFGFHLK